MPRMAEAVNQAKGRLYQLAYLWSGDRSRAHEHVLVALRHLAGEPDARARVLDASDPAAALVGVLARQLDRVERGRMSLRMLDAALRSDLTDPRELPPAGTDPDYEALLWELKRTCLVTVLGAVSAPQRLAFILTYVFGYGRLGAAEMLKIDVGALSVRNTRAQAVLRDYLGARCQYTSPYNPCYCRGRLAIATRVGFVRPPPHRDDVPPTPCDTVVTREEPGSVYGSLPPIAPTAEQQTELDAVLGVLDGGAVRDDS